MCAMTQKWAVIKRAPQHNLCAPRLIHIMCTVTSALTRMYNFHRRSVGIRVCVLQCVAVCYGVLQCIAACCSSRIYSSHWHSLSGVLRCVFHQPPDISHMAVCCGVLRYVAVCCGVLQCVAIVGCRIAIGTQWGFACVCCSVLQCVAVCCSVLQ